MIDFSSFCGVFFERLLIELASSNINWAHGKPIIFIWLWSKKVHLNVTQKSLTLHRSILHLLTLSYQFFHTLKISKANSSIIERQKNDEAFFCHFFRFFCKLHRSENSIILLPFQALCVKYLTSRILFPPFSHVEESAEKFQDMNRKLIYCERRWWKSFFFVFLIERPITLFYWI